MNIFVNRFQHEDITSYSRYKIIANLYHLLRTGYINPFEFYYRDYNSSEYIGLISTFHLWGWSQRDRNNPDTIEDKWETENRLRAFNLPTTKTLEVYSDVSEKPKSEPSVDLIAKPRNGTMGKGVGLYKPELLPSLVRQFGDEYLIQRRLNPDPRTSKFNGGKLVTARVLTYQEEKDSSCYSHIMVRHSSTEDVTDNLSNLRNCAFAVTYSTIEKYRKQGYISAFRSDNSSVILEFEGLNNFLDLLTGYCLDLIDLAHSAHKIFNTRIVGWDIALTDKGLVIVEGNQRPSFKSLQITHQMGYRGMNTLTPVPLPLSECSEQILYIVKEWEIVIDTLDKALRAAPYSEIRKSLLTEAYELSMSIMEIRVKV